ncbi:MAG: hypothetical protein ACJAS3_000655 [Roseivirga sp.]|jgi:hypothetical protein
MKEFNSMNKKAENEKVEKDKPELKAAVISVKKEELIEDPFDFGGLPRDVPFKRNLGCGG